MEMTWLVWSWSCQAGVCLQRIWINDMIKKSYELVEAASELA